MDCTTLGPRLRLGMLPAPSSSAALTLARLPFIAIVTGALALAGLLPPDAFELDLGRPATASSSCSTPLRGVYGLSANRRSVRDGARRRRPGRSSGEGSGCAVVVGTSKLGARETVWRRTRTLWGWCPSGGEARGGSIGSREGSP